MARSLRSWLRPAAIVAAAGCIIGIVLVYRSASDYFLAEAARQGRAAMALHVEVVRGWLGRFRALAPVYARDPAVVALLRAPDDGVQLDLVNRKLEVWTTLSGASDTYLLDTTGMAIAASNWADDISFVGNDYSYRPYYTQAMEGRLGRFFALGTASLKRGYYFSHPIRDRNQIIGVAVVKVGVDEIEHDLRNGPHEVFVTDEAGVIVLAGNPEWRLKTLEPLTEAERERIGSVRQYDLSALTTAPISGITHDLPEDGSEHVSAMPDRSGARVRDFLHLSRDMTAENWRMHLLVDTRAAHAQALTAAALAGLILLALALAATILWQRRRRLIERLGERERAGALLEKTVAERTADLRETNIRLEAEVAERITAETELRRTQADLVQAGKLAALGQMSAALSHEFNQPLTAVRSYAENAIAFLERGGTEQATRNITRISTLTQRMAQLSRHLSSFARKPDADIRPVLLQEVFDETLGLLQGRLERAGVDPVVEGLEVGLAITGGSVRLQHVLMNLIGNAVDALEGRADPEIRIVVAATGDQVTIAVEDNGPGIPDADMGRIFDPFFTTKGVGKGLGLGLSISYNIIRDFGGTIRAENRPEGGARFILTLNRAATAAEGSPVEAAE